MIESRDDLLAELSELESQERLLSAERRRVQDRLDVFGGTGSDDDTCADLRVRERDLSDRRVALHREIDSLRGRLGLPGES